MPKYYIGLSTSGHDPALALADEKGNIIFAEATERFIQQKRAWGICPDHPDLIRQVISENCNPNATFFMSKSWSKTKQNLPLDIKGGFLFEDIDIQWLLSLQAKVHNNTGINLKQFLGKEKLIHEKDFDHHLCHAVNACYFTSVSSGICLVIDGEGEVGSASLYKLEGRSLKRIWRSWGPGSLGSYYGWLTRACGFDWRLGEEWKVMGLAAFGKPIPELVEILKKAVHVESGRLRFPDDKTMKLCKDTLNKNKRNSNEDIMIAANLAASGQEAYTHFVDQIISHCESYNERNLILSGGCALNSSYNGTITKKFDFDEVFVPCAPADDGNAIGAALLAWMHDNKTTQIPISNGSPFLGKSAVTKYDEKKLKNIAAYGQFSSVKDLGDKTSKVIAQKLKEGKIIGVMRGKAEFGPRALGNRSILADPSNPKMKDIINERVKGREPYRPFAPVVLKDRITDFFEFELVSPYMSFTLPWIAEKGNLVPAVVHEDGTGRLQTVSKELNPWMEELLQEFEKITGTPIVLNTSFNVMGKPIVNSIEDALAVLVTTGLDGVLIENTLIEK